jgi:sigma-B regulation protein RsbU (phosphoserine phosphatase)
MFPFRKSLGFRLLLIGVILLALPLLLDSFILAKRRYYDALNDAKNYLMELANFKEIPLEEIEPLSSNFLAIMERYLDLEKGLSSESDNEKMRSKLEAFSTLGDFYTIFLVKITPSKQFEIISSNQKRFEGKNLNNFFAFLDLLSEKDTHREYVVRVAYDPVTLQPFFIVTRPIYEKEKLVGFLVLTDTANLGEKLEGLLAPDLKNYPVNFALLLPSSIVFSASDPSLQFHYFAPLSEEYRKAFMQQEPFAASLVPEESIKIDNVEGDFFEFEWQNKRQIGYKKELAEASYTLLTYASREDIFTDPLHDFADLYFVFLLIILLGTLFSYFLVKRMAMPMGQLTNVMQKIREGELEKRYVFDRWGFEINKLGTTFNEMLDSLIEKKRKAEQERISKEGYARELKLGQQVQRNLLPKEMPSYKGVELAAMYIPAIDVGGDYFDLFVDQKTEGEKLYLAIADASGKGVQACFYSLGVRSLLRTFAKSSEGIASAMHSTNKIFCEDAGVSGMFITVWMGEYDHRSKKLIYYSCGHNPPLLRRKDGLVESLHVQDAAMGLLDSSEKKADEITLFEGDLLVLYTDGVTESHNTQQKLFGEERLIAFMKQYGELGAKAFVDKLVEEITIFSGKAPQHDDITLLVMKVVQ